MISSGGDSRMDIEEEKKATALHRAAKDGLVDVVKDLLEKGAHDPNRRDSKGKTPLMYAAALPGPGKSATNA